MNTYSNTISIKTNIIRRIRITWIFFLVLSLCLMGSNTFAASPKSPKLNIRNLSIVKNSKYNLRVYNTPGSYTVTFESDDEDIAVLRKIRNTSCRIVAKDSGTTAINAYIYDEDDELVTTLKCAVTVSPRAASVKFNKKKYRMTEGSTRKIKAIVKPNTSSEYPLYSSDDPDIAMVSSNGTVTALSAGQTTIRAYISNGNESSYLLTVVRSDNSASDNNNYAIIAEAAASPSPAPSAEPEAHSKNKKEHKPQANYNIYPNIR